MPITTIIQIQWGLEYRTCPEFELAKVAQMLNGSDFKWHSKIEQPNHSKSADQIAAILDSYALFPFQMVRIIAVAMVSIIIIPNHPVVQGNAQ